MRTLSLLVATTALLLTAAIPAQAQDIGIKNPETSTPVKLYFHVVDVQDMPINTQVPNDEFTDLGNYGTGTNTLKCLDPTLNPVTKGSTSQVFHTNYGYSSPSYVEYDYVNTQGQPRTHPERGISYDAVFDPAVKQILLTYYVAVYNGGQPQDQIPTPTPNMVVAATMKTGDAISIDDAGYDGGETIAEGRTEPVMLVPGGANAPAPYNALPGPTSASGSPSTQVTYSGVSEDGHHVYKFEVPMDIKLPTILRATGFNVRIDMYMDNAACSAEGATSPDKLYLMPGTVAPYSDKDHRPTMEFSVMNPVRLEYLHPQFVGDDLVVHTSMNSVWGNYDVGELNPMTPDVDASYIQVSIEGPSPATSLARAAIVQRTHEHYRHQEAVDITYLWPYKTDRASNGAYTVFVSFKNDQGTAEATGTAKFEIGKGTVIGCGGIQEASQKLNDDCAETVQVDGQTAAEESPGLPLAGALAALGAVAVALRRRKA